jgi:signal transduction histidine kinase
MIYIKLSFFLLSFLIGKQTHSEPFKISPKQFTENTIIELSENWKFYWKELLSYPDTNKISYHVNFSSIWNKLGHIDQKITSTGYASYYLSIYSDSESTELALDIPGFYSSYRLFLNGEEMAKNGVVAKTKEESKPFWLPRIVSIKINKGINHLVLQISNFRHSKGGASKNIKIGKYSNLLSQDKFQLAVDFFLFGILLVTGVFIFGFYFFGQKEKYLIYFALFCFAYGYRQISYGDFHVNALMPFIPWQLTITIEYIVFALSVYFFANYVLYIFPKEANRKILNVIIYASLTYIALVVLLPVFYFTYLIPYFLFLIFSYMFYAIYVFFKAYISQRLGAKYALISLLFIFSSFILLMIEQVFQARINTFLVFTSFLGFLFFQVMILSYSFAMFYQQALIDANSGLRAKSIFLASISHEIRTPLSAILGASEILEKTELAENQNAFVNIIKRSSLNLNVIISDILNLTKLEYSQVRFNEEHVNVVTLVEDIIQTQFTNQNFDKTKLEFSHQHDPQMPLYVISDSTRLKQILTNLFYNAIKFTKQGSISIHNYLENIDDEFITVRFEVRDTGIGIQKDKLNELFDQFSQVDSANKHGLGGIGLGLYICKVLVNKLNGEIWVESEKGNGSSFYFTAKVKKADEDELITEAYKVNDQTQIYMSMLNNETGEMLQNFSTIMELTSIERIENSDKLIKIVKSDPKAILITKEDIFEHLSKVDLINLDHLKVIVVVNNDEDLDSDIELIESVTTLIKPIKLSSLHARIKAFLKV